MRPPMIAWIIGLILVIALYTVGPVFFNSATPAILGMPPLYFWFVLVPLLNPIILGTVYLIDRREQPVTDEGEY